MAWGPQYLSVLLCVNIYIINDQLSGIGAIAEYHLT